MMLGVGGGGGELTIFYAWNRTSPIVRCIVVSVSRERVKVS